MAVTFNAVNLLSSGINGGGPNTQVPFAKTQTVAAGDVIDFSVGYGSNGTYFYDSTGLAAAVSYVLPPYNAVNDFPRPWLPLVNGSIVPDYSQVHNPNGTWSYGFKTSAASTMLTSLDGATSGTSGQQAFASDPPAFDLLCSNVSSPSPPGIAHNGSGAYQTDANASQPPDLLNLHPGPNGERTTVRWTAPYTGSVILQGRFQGIAASAKGTTTDVAINHNGTALPVFNGSASAAVTGYGSPSVVPFSTTRAVTAGDVMNFSVGYGSDGNYFYDSTGFMATIAYTYASPTAQALYGQWQVATNWPSSSLLWPNAQGETNDNNIRQAGDSLSSLVAIHSSVLPNGNVMSWQRSPQGANPPAGYSSGAPTYVTQQVYQLTPNIANPNMDFAALATPQPTAKPTFPNDLFCSGHLFLPDGRLLVTGGNIANFRGTVYANAFNAFTNTWSPLPDMSMGRWYPTMCPLGDGEALTLSGDIDQPMGVNPSGMGQETSYHNNRTPEVWTGTGWRQLTGASDPFTQLYPWLHLAPDGTVFNSGPDPSTQFLNTSGTGAWSAGPGPLGWRDPQRRFIGRLQHVRHRRRPARERHGGRRWRLYARPKQRGIH